LKSIATILFLALATSPLSADELTVRLMDHLVVTSQTHPDLPLREVSALTWDAQDGTLLAVSDRNDLYHPSLGPDHDRIELTLTAQVRLTDETGQRQRGRDFSAEGAALAEPGSGRIAILSEMPPRLSLFDGQGRRLRDLPLPPELRDVARLRSKGNGLESLALHPKLGYLVAPEKPLADQPRRTHVVYGAAGPALAFHTGEAGSTNIKAMETLPDGRLLILERDRLNDVTIRPFLRVIDPAACPVADPCSIPAVPLALLPPFDADFEGIAWLGANRVLLASDDRIDGQFRTVFALIELVVAD
jgi:hypothetical protein